MGDMTGGRPLRFYLESNIREIVFGLEDSLVSTLGAVTGIAAGTGNTFVVILSGVVLIFVEALSMSAGSYLSSKSAREVLDKRQRQDASRLLQSKLGKKETLQAFFKKKKLSKKEVDAVMTVIKKERSLFEKELRKAEHQFSPSVQSSSVKAGVVMGVFYLSGGIFPLAPYFFLPVETAIIPSIVITGIVLFALGAGKARIVHTPWVKSGSEMMVVSLSAALLGFLIGRAVAIIFGISAV